MMSRSVSIGGVVRLVVSSSSLSSVSPKSESSTVSGRVVVNGWVVPYLASMRAVSSWQNAVSSVTSLPLSFTLETRAVRSSPLIAQGNACELSLPFSPLSVSVMSDTPPEIPTDPSGFGTLEVHTEKLILDRSDVADRREFANPLAIPEPPKSTRTERT